MRSRERLPSLGPRGEGWVVGQFLLMALVGILGLRRGRRAAGNRAARVVRVLVGGVLLGAGVEVARQGARDLGSNLTVLPHPRREGQLVETGIYGRVRHPLYLAALFVAVGWGTAFGSIAALIVSALLAAWLDAKARLEEAWLAERFPGYAAYRARTARFLPGLY
jgi:protein-S-isoprenylcysteine O-methyltransferase Ste14